MRLCRLSPTPGLVLRQSMVYLLQTLGALSGLLPAALAGNVKIKDENLKKVPFYVMLYFPLHDLNMKSGNFSLRNVDFF